MQDVTTTDDQVIAFRRDIDTQLRTRIREAIQVVLEEELDEALGCSRYRREDSRKGYRHGTVQRRITTPNGPQTLEVPRGRLVDAEGKSTEFRSQLLPRYARRCREVDEAILGAYLAGANSRRIRKALAPLLGEEHLSKSAVSRVVSRLKAHFATWQARDLSSSYYPIVYLDGIHLKVRLARRVISVPVLAVLGVDGDGRKVLVSLQLALSEASVHWKGVIEDLLRRGLPAPELVISDGHGGLTKAIKEWPEARIQRCTQHKWRNLAKHCPSHARAELKRDWDAIVFADDGKAARKAYDALHRKWSVLVPAVVRSLEEAGLQLLSFYEFPKSMWKSLRSTNAVENLNREFRRRTKTQGSFSTEAAAVTLLWALVAFDQITLRRIVGHKDLHLITDQRLEEAA
ncbi:MAG: IS256 family transposase [bacterium]|nr:IS256 family transposase [bacterium]